jgi:hypothetical protein
MCTGLSLMLLAASRLPLYPTELRARRGGFYCRFRSVTNDWENCGWGEDWGRRRDFEQQRGSRWSQFENAQLLHDFVRELGACSVRRAQHTLLIAHGCARDLQSRPGLVQPVAAPLKRNAGTPRFQSVRKVGAGRRNGSRLHQGKDLRAAAEAGNPCAQCELGRYYMEGVPGILSPDRTARINWFRKSAAQGYPPDRRI